MQGWTKLKENPNLFPTNTQSTMSKLLKNQKLVRLQAKNYATSKDLKDWLTIAEQVIKEDQDNLNQLLADKATYSNQIAQLKTSLGNEPSTFTVEQKDTEKKVLTYTDKLETITKDIEYYTNINDFVYKELEKFQDPDFLNDRKEQATNSNDTKELQNLAKLNQTLIDQAEAIILLKSSVKSTSQKHEIVKRTSLQVLERTTSQPIVPTITTLEEITENNNKYSDLRELLNKTKKRWENHTSEVEKDDDAYQGQEDIIKELTLLIEQALEPTNDIKQLTTDLLKTWDNDYSDWRDVRRDKHWLKMYLEYCEHSSNEEANEELKDKLVGLEVDKKALEASLENAKQVIKKKNEAWTKLNERSTKDLEKAVKAKDREYKTFINPKNKKVLEKTAKDELEMSTKEEVEEAVNEAKIPLQVWETTFLNKTAKQVKEIQDQLQEEKKDLNREKEELIKGKEKLATERRKFMTDLKTVESQLKSIKEDREALEEEKETYLNGFDKEKDKVGEAREEIARLKAIIYNLGVDPNEGKEEVVSEEENNSSAEDDDDTELKSNSSSVEKTENDNSDNEEENNEITSHEYDEEEEDEEQQEVSSPKIISSEQSSRSSTPIEEQLLTENDGEEGFDENKLNEDELNEEEKELLKQIKEHKANFEKYIKKEKEVTDVQFLKQIEEIKADLNKWISEKKQKLRELIEKERNEKLAQIEV